MPRRYLNEGDRVVATGAEIWYDGVGKWSVYDIAAHGEIFFDGLSVAFDKKDRPYVESGDSRNAPWGIGKLVKGGHSMKKSKKHKIHPIREQILDIAEDVSANPGSALLTVGIFAALGVGGFFLAKKFIFKKKAEAEPPVNPPSATPVAPNTPVPLAGDKSLAIGKSYTIQSLVTPGSSINVRSGPGVSFEPPVKQLAGGNYIVKISQKDTAGNTWGQIYTRKFYGQGVYGPDKEIGWVFSGYLKYSV
jgi:hypothetical protein